MAFTKPYLLDYYEVENPWDINIVHGVNDRERFESHLNNPSIHMFEVDVEVMVATLSTQHLIMKESVTYHLLGQ